MATARELLEQADALMRRNRARLDDDIPVLTDEVDVVDELESETEPAAAVAAVASAPVEAGAPLVAPTLDDIPLLTDAVEEIEALSIQESVDSEGEPSDWLDIGRSEASVIGDAPDSISMVPPLAHRRHPSETGDPEGADPALASPAEATVPRADAADADVTADEVALAESAGIELAELDSARGWIQDESAGAPENERAELEAVAKISVQIESAEIESAEHGSAELESAEIESVEPESAEFEPVGRESIEAPSPEIELADVEFVEPGSPAREFADVASEPIDTAEAEMPAVAFAGGSFGIPATEDFGLAAPESDEFEYTGAETAEDAIAPRDVDDAEFAAARSEQEEVTGPESAEVPDVAVGMPAETSHGVAPAMRAPGAGASDVAPVAAATTLFARGAAALLHGAKALLGGQSLSPSAAIKPEEPSIESAGSADADAAAAPARAPAPTVGVPAAIDTIPFEGMSPETALGSAALPTPEAIRAAAVDDTTAPESEAAMPPALAEGLGAVGLVQDLAPAGPTATAPGGTDTATHGVATSVPFDTAQWDAMAEEIRMQVLQRIDLFTDTGLRAQLGARLQPVVDRASADLVATINQHVGEILRAYVAEAIEREIDNWRRDH